MKFSALSATQRQNWDTANAEARKSMIDMLELTEIPGTEASPLGALAQFNVPQSGYGERTKRLSFGSSDKKITSGDFVLAVGNGKVGHIKKTAMQTLVSGITAGVIKSLQITVDPDGNTHLDSVGDDTFTMYTAIVDGKETLLFGPNAFLPKITVKGTFTETTTI